MWYALTIDLKIILCIFLQKLYGLIANISFCFFKTYHPFVIRKIKKEQVEELRKSIQTLEKNNELAERILKIHNDSLSRTKTLPEYESIQLQDSYKQMVKTINENAAKTEKELQLSEELILQAQRAIVELGSTTNKVRIQPERNFLHYYFMVVQFRKRKYGKQIKLYSGFNRKFF